MANSEKVTYASLFDFSNPSEVDQAIKKVASLDAVYESLENQASQTRASLQSTNTSLVNSLKAVSSETSKLSAASQADQKVIEQQNAELQALTATYEVQQKQIAALTKQLDTLSKERTKVAAKAKDVNNINKEAIALEARLGKAVGNNAKEVARLRLQLQEKNKATKQEAKETLGLVSIYQKESQQLTNLRNKFRDLVLAGKENSSVAKQMEKDITSLNNRLTKVDSRVGVYGRNVGNYASTWNGLGNSINQLTREAPAFAVSMSTGFLALSNNIPILADEIKNLTAKNKELIAQGKPTKNVFKSIAGAIFSWQTLLSVGVTVLTIYGAKLFEMGKAAIEGVKAFDALGAVQGEANKLASQSAGKFSALVKVVNDNTKSEKERKAAIKELNQEYPDFIKNIDSEGDSLNITTSEANAYIKTLEKRALAQAALNLVEEEYEKLLLEKQELQKIEKELSKEQIDAAIAYSDKLKEGTFNGRQASKASEKLSQGQRDYVIQLKDVNAEQEKINSLLELFSSNYDENTFGDVASGVKKMKDEFKSFVASEDIEEFDGSELFRPTIFGRKLEAAYQVLKENVMATQKELTNESLAETDRLLAEELYKEKEHQKAKNQLRQSGWEAATIVGNQFFENQNIKRENSLKMLEDEKNYELQLAGDNAQQRAQIEADFARKERDIRLKQAKAAKKQALFNVTIQTAQAVINALATLPYPAAPIAAAAAGVVGAAQSIAVLSEPLPAFEKGGVVGGNSPIITSEKGYEYAVKPDGELIKTGSNGAEVRTDIPKGSVVLNHAISKQLDQGGFNHREINDDSSFKISKVLLEQRDRQTQILAHTILKGDNMVADAIEDTIKRMPMPEWNISDGKLKKYIKKANTRRNAYESQIRH